MATKPSQKTVKFSYTAPHAKSVAVAGSFNKWSATAHPMKKNAKEQWNCSLKLAPGRYEYRFVVNGNEWVNDPAAKECCPNPLGGQNCVVHVR